MMHEPGRKRKAALDEGTSKAAHGAVQMMGAGDNAISFATPIVADSRSHVKLLICGVYITPGTKCTRLIVPVPGHHPLTAPVRRGGPNPGDPTAAKISARAPHIPDLDQAQHREVRNV